MRPLPSHKTHGVIHSVRVSKEHIDEIAKHLGIPDNMKKWLGEGHEIHIVREANETELNRNKP